jgi:hypothetical protein
MTAEYYSARNSPDIPLMNNQETTSEIEPQGRRSLRESGKAAAQRAGTHGDFLTAMSFIGDSIIVLLGLMVGFWIRFRSTRIPFFGREDAHLPLRDYLPLFFIGRSFLVLAFAYLGLYELSVLLRLRRVADIIVRGTFF